MSDAAGGTDIERVLQECEPAEIIRRYPERVDAAIERAEANDRHVFAAAIRKARETARRTGGDGRGE